MQSILFLLLTLPALLFSQQSQGDSIWLPLQPFIGEWIGEGEGMSGKGAYERSYQFVLNKNFIEIKNRSTYPPSAQNPEGEIHEDIGYLSYDKQRKLFVLRQFHVEGFVNTYSVDSLSADQQTMVFVTEGIENIPDGWRAKETYRILGPNTLEETFELAEPGKDFFQYSHVKLIRKR